MIMCFQNIISCGHFSHLAQWDSTHSQVTPPPPWTLPAPWMGWNMVLPFLWLFHHMGVSKNREKDPKWMVYKGKKPIKIHDLGVPLFLETPIFYWSTLFIMILLPQWAWWCISLISNRHLIGFPSTHKKCHFCVSECVFPPRFPYWDVPWMQFCWYLVSTKWCLMSTFQEYYDNYSHRSK